MSYNFEEQGEDKWEENKHEEKCCHKEERCVKVNIYTECKEDKKCDKGGCGCVEVNVFVKCA